MDELNTDGDCSLREAIRAANLNTAVDACPAGSSSTTDTIIVPSGIYTLTRTGGDDTASNGDLDITDDLTLSGAGADSTLVDGNALDRVVHVLTATVQLSGVTLRNGNSGGSQGGGLRNQGGAVTLTASTVLSNTTGNHGGGIYNTGTLTLTASAVLSNTITGSGTGGGIHNDGGTLTLLNVTVSGNRVLNSGGGLRNTNSGTITLNNVTLTNNTADSNADGTGDGGGLYRSSGTVNLKNTLLAGNADNSSGTQHPDCSGSVTSQGYNLVGIDTGCSFTTQPGDQRGTSGSPINPQLGLLADNGGPTLTHALLTGSPAINAGTNSGCPATDQRGYARDATCDIGAYEYGASGAAGGAVLSAAPHERSPSVQLANFPLPDSVSPRVMGDALQRPLFQSGGELTTTIITYTYDALYRLTSAAYSNGNVFTYTYDVVGNQLSATLLPGGVLTYTYDAANRMTHLGSAPMYTWDNNGNLISEFRRTYTYDAANRLTAVDDLVDPAGPHNHYTFRYNGLGDRLQQTTKLCGGISCGEPVTTTYTLDLNAGLTQVLADGTSAYLYGNGRIAQQSAASTEYFLTDGLGSVRQLTNASANVTLAQSYQPYGFLLSSAGTGASNYAFAGEWQDATGLLHLRARYYGPQWGRFITRDPFPGVYTRPASLHPYAYGYNNPILYTDPSGKTPILLVCLGLALADGPLPFGEATCAILLAGLGIAALSSSIYVAQHPEVVTRFVDTVGDTCTRTWERILRSPVRPSVIEPDWKPESGQEPEPEPDPRSGRIWDPFPPIEDDTDEKRVALFRAIGEKEQATVLALGNYGYSPSASGKYFAFTEEGARRFAKAPINRGRKMTITSTTIPEMFLDYGYQFNDPGTYGAGWSIHFSEEVLPELYKVMSPIIIMGPP